MNNLKNGSGNIISLNKIILSRKKQIYNIKQPDKLLEFIHNSLIPKDIEKKTRGEVFTPMKLVNEMLDKLPKSIWTDTTLKWLDPSSGIGNFPVAIYLRLMVSLKDKIPNDEERRKHILENMIYMVELNKVNVFMMKKILCSSSYKLNIFEGSFLDYKTLIQFDIIVGNPPYQNTTEEGDRKALNHNLWSVFIDISFNKLLKKNGYLLFITPYSWMTEGFKYKDVFYKNYIIYLNINECNKWFNGIGSTFSYYLIKKTNKKKETNVICEYEKEIYKSKILINNDTNFLPTLLTKESLSIITKFYNNKIKKISFKSSCELHSSTKKNLIGICNKIVFKYPILHTSSYEKTLCSKIKHSLSDENKILLNKSGYLNPIYDNGKFGFTENYVYLLTDNKKYIEVLNSNLYKFIFKICKWSGFNAITIFNNIPYINIFISNNNINMLFKINKDEIMLINKVLNYNNDISQTTKRHSIGGNKLK